MDQSTGSGSDGAAAVDMQSEQADNPVSDAVQDQSYGQEEQLDIRPAHLQPELRTDELQGAGQEQDTGVQQFESQEHPSHIHMDQQPDALHQGQELHHVDAQMAEAAAQQIDPSQLVGLPMSLTPLQTLSEDMQEDGQERTGKFKPIDLDRLTPKSRQRVLRNRQAATRSKAKKKQQYTLLKDRKSALEAELEQMEAQHAATQLRIQQLHLENKALIESYKPEKIEGEAQETMA